MSIRIERGSRSSQVQTVEQFLTRHGFLTFRDANRHHGTFSNEMQNALVDFVRRARGSGIDVAGISADAARGNVITDGTLDAMIAWEQRHQDIYRTQPGRYGRSAGTYVLDPTSETLTRTDTKARTPLRRFDADRVTFVIDAGHGVTKPIRGQGIYDRGAEVAGKEEAEITRQIANRVAGALNRMGYDAIVTRDDEGSTVRDNGFGFRNRAALAGTAGFISLHADIAGPAASGTRVFVDRRAEAGGESRDLRREIANRDAGDVIADSKHRERGLAMLSPRVIGQAVPAALIEMGFLTNSSDRARLTNPAWQEKFANELASDLVQFSDMRSDLVALRRGGRSERTAAPLPPQAPRKEREDAPETPKLTPGTPRIYRYEIQAGDTLTSISRRFGIDMKDLKQVNRGAGDHIEVGDKLILPDVRQAVIASGATLASYAADIARTSDLDQRGALKLLAELNNLEDPSKIKAGQKLFIPKDAAAAEEMLERLAPAKTPRPAASRTV